MAKFEVGKTYRLNAFPGNYIRIESRTKCYVTYSGMAYGKAISGKRRIDPEVFPGDCTENVFIPFKDVKAGFIAFSTNEISPKQINGNVRISRKFAERILAEKVADTRKYRYTYQKTSFFSTVANDYIRITAIMRLPIEKLSTPYGGALCNWEAVKTIY